MKETEVPPSISQIQNRNDNDYFHYYFYSNNEWVETGDAILGYRMRLRKGSIVNFDLCVNNGYA